MNKKALGILEYNKIIELLKEETGCAMSRDMAQALNPETDPRVISEELRSTTEAVDLIVHKGPLPTGGLYDVEGMVSLARKGGCLTMRQLLQIHYDLAIADRVVTFLHGEVPEMPLIMSLAELIVPHERLEKEIDRCIVSEDEMADSASPKLRDIRRGIMSQNDSIRNRLNRIVNSRSNQAYLQDAIVTIKDGRYVIPVKQEHRARFPGIVHDQSKAGATLFIEPQAIVDMNNELRELELAEQQEIARILQSLSDQVAECYHDLRNNQDILGRLDYIMAKGKLSMRLKGEEPKLSEDGTLVLRSARHPLLDPQKVVPIDVEVGGAYRTLVVTGPNTGGKTVTLKTIGLLSMMAQSGLHIPASCESRIPVYQEIFADIGDEQSIEQSLSTFSSHMKNIVHIVEHAGEGALVLLDELGAGTDPTEGAALAISILEKLYQQGAQTVATTHYNELKKYALSTEGVKNASMEFDVETLSPTYRLIIGTPGRSNAFEISRKLGLSDELIDRAALLIEHGDIQFEDVIGAIEEDKKQAEAERDEAIRIAEEMKESQLQMEKAQQQFEKQRERMMADAREDARAILREARETAREVQKELKELSRLDSLGERNKRFDKSRRKLKEKEAKYAERVVKQVNTEPVSASQLKVGDSVKVLSLEQNGELLSLPDSKGNVTVQLGIMKTTVPLEDLMIVVDGKKTKARKPGRTSYGNLMRSKSQTVKTSINVQGENLDSARMDVGKYIDDAFMAGLKEVTVIHGRGKGILANGLRKALKKNKHVASVRPGKFDEGGEGVTVVKLKTE
jgi:DNA mismatch repair protein MutS2